MSQYLGLSRFSKRTERYASNDAANSISHFVFDAMHGPRTGCSSCHSELSSKMIYREGSFYMLFALLVVILFWWCRGEVVQRADS